VNDAYRKSLDDLIEKLTAPLIFLGATTLAAPSFFTRRGFRKRELYYYLDLCGVQSVVIVILLCFMLGGCMALQSWLQLRKFGTDIFTADLVGFAIIKEFGPLMVAVIATGRAGSAFAAEIGTMKVNDEISALQTMGMRPEGYLVMPKMLAMLITVPLLTVIGEASSIFGGMMVGVSYAELPAPIYWEHTLNVLNAVDFLLGILKSVFFAALITLCGCYAGFQAASDAQGVGRGATQAVVSSIFFLIIADSVLTVIYSFFGH